MHHSYTQFYWVNNIYYVPLSFILWVHGLCVNNVEMWFRQDDDMLTLRRKYADAAFGANRQHYNEDLIFDFFFFWSREQYSISADIRSNFTARPAGKTTSGKFCHAAKIKNAGVELKCKGKLFWRPRLGQSQTSTSDGWNNGEILKD